MGITNRETFVHQENRAPNPDLDSVRSALISRAIKSWTDELIDLGGRNNLLNYRDLKRGTLDLSEDYTSDLPVIKLLRGDKVRLSALFEEPAVLNDAVLRARTLYAKAKENVGCNRSIWLR